MSRDEAIKFFEWMINLYPEETAQTAFGMAIKALKQPEPCEDAVSRQAAIDALKNERSDWNDDYNVPVDHCIDAINRLPSVTPKPDVADINVGKMECEDCVSRKDVIAELYAWMKDVFGIDDASKTTFYNRLMELPSVTPLATNLQQTCNDEGKLQECEDCLSREDVKRTIMNHIEDLNQILGDGNELSSIVSNTGARIMKLPSVTPKKTGKWIPCSENPVESGKYIVTLKDADGYYVNTAEWNPTFGGRWQDVFFDCEYRDISNVVAWMPLPEPYREEGEQDGNEG